MEIGVDMDILHTSLFIGSINAENGRLVLLMVVVDL